MNKTDFQSPKINLLNLFKKYFPYAVPHFNVQVSLWSKRLMHHYQPYFDLADLIAKHLRDELTDQEKKQLDDWLETSADNRELFKKLTNESLISIQHENYLNTDKEQAWKNIINSTGFNAEAKKRHPAKTFFYYAAVLAALLTVSLFISKPPAKTSTGIKIAARQPDIMPGGNKAVLTLANGTKINLDDAKHGQIARQQFISISKTQNGQLTYTIAGAASAADLKAMQNLVAMNTIATPRGGQYEVVLPDGTQVWLNAASSLTYPVVFKGKEREVTLTGEAYFEVTKNTEKPFEVKTAGQVIEVLGTHFNVNSYADEKATVTTLLEGSVKVHDHQGNGAVIKPGQQAVNASGAIRVVNNADLDEAMAWKNGKFLFRNTDLHTVMRQLSRWYDVDVEYQGFVSEKHYQGRISRNVPVSQVFEILKTSGINFTISGRTIIVK